MSGDACHLKVILTIPGSLTMNKSGWGRAVGNLWAAWNVLCLAMSGWKLQEYIHICLSSFKMSVVSLNWQIWLITRMCPEASIFYNTYNPQNSCSLAPFNKRSSTSYFKKCFLEQLLLSPVYIITNQKDNLEKDSVGFRKHFLHVSLCQPLC